MNTFVLVSNLLRMAEEIVQAIADAIAAGKSAADVHGTITDHLAELPGKIRAI